MSHPHSSPRPFPEEGVSLLASTAPRPATLAAQEAINPIPKLLLSFPVPRMISQMQLETTWPREEEVPAGATDSAETTTSRKWTAEGLDGVVGGMQQSAQNLLITGSYSRFFQEQFHHEAVPHIAGAARGVRADGQGVAPSQVASHVSTAVSSGLRGLLASMGQPGTVLEVPLSRKSRGEALGSSAAAAPCEVASRQRVPLTRVPKTESWTRSDEGPTMSLRPRRPTGLGVGGWAGASSESLDSGVGSVGAVAADAGATSAAGSHAAAVGFSQGATLAAANGYEPRTGSWVASMNALGSTLPQRNDASTPFAEWVSQQAECGCTKVSVASIHHFISALPLQLHPFAGIGAEEMTSFLSSLVGNAAITKTVDGNAHWAARGLLCCQCLAHPHFPAESVQEGLVSRIIDSFARVVRDVAACLQDEQQAGAGAAAEPGRENEERLLSATGKGTAGASLLSPLLEHLRGFLGAFAVVLCNPHLRLTTDTDLLRLEELCHQCLFRLSRSCTKELHALYSSYAVDSAVHLYRCVWNGLAVQRQRTVEHFMQQLPVSEMLSQRTYQTNFDGRAVLPLTVAMLAAAQSTPLPRDAVCAANAEVLQWQCGLWANTFVQEFLLNCVGERDKTEDAAAWMAAIRVAEDLVELLSVPEWPGADLLLRSFVMALAQLTLGSEAAISPSAEALRPLAVDVLGHVAVKLFDAQRFPVSSAIVAEMERLGESAGTSQAAAHMALQHVMAGFSSLRAEDRPVWRRLCGDVADGSASDSSEPDGRLLDLMAAVYMAESRLISSPATSVDYAAVWLHVRAARLMAWVCFQDAARPSVVPVASLDALVRWRSPSSSSSSSSSSHTAEWAHVCAWTQAISTQSPKSMLSLHMRHMLVSMLFSVFQLKDGQGVSVSVADVVQRKTLAHLTRLTAVHPPLHRYLWPIVRQCVRDDSARVRESIVPLLLTLLSDAAEVEAAADAPTSGHMTSLTPEGIAAEVISSLLHLLGDKSVSVVSRTIAALDTFLTDQSYHHLLATPQGASLLSFIQQKLLLFASPTAEPKHQQEVVKHFLHRWVITLADSDGSLTGAHAQLAKELVTLTTMAAPAFPFDVADDHPLVHVLQGMHAHVLAHDPSAEAARQATGAAAASAPTAAAPHPRRRSRGYHIDIAQLLHVMRCASQSLWMRYQCFHSSEDAVACLATLRVLTLARSEWVMPLAEVFVQSLAYPPPSTSPLASAAEALGGALLQLCLVLYGILHSPKLPLISLDYLARCLTALLSKYVGPFQQRVIVASCGALCALITCGAKHRLSTQVNVPYLQLCYSLMNTYYCRVRALLPTLASQPQSVAYTQRFLFLLSEFLRMYPGWRQQPPHPALLDDAVTSSGIGNGAQASGTSGAPNQLAKGLGIMANTYQLLEDVLQSCGNSRTRERVSVIALRVVASLCMLDPTTYLYRAETQIRAALASADPNLQLQGLSLLSDFLKEEDERVDTASRTATRLDTTALILGSREATPTSRSGSRHRDDVGDGNEKPSKRLSRTSRETTTTTASSPTKGARNAKPARLESGGTAPLLKRKTSTKHGQTAGAALAATTAEDFNSGMSTWIFQTFHDDIARLGGGSAHVAVRSLCLKLLQQASQGGLLPPDKYVRIIIALAADVHAPLRQQAAASLAGHCDRHEEVVAASVGRGVVLAFDLHHACGADLLRSAVLMTPSVSVSSERKAASCGATGYGCEQSVHSALYGLLHKRSRDNMVTTLVRLFYQDNKVAHWCEEHAEHLAVWASPLTADAAVSSAGSAGIFGVVHPLLFLCHLTVALFTLPYQHESDVMHVLQQCRVALDLNGQSALDWLRDTETDATASATLMQWKAIGSLLLSYLQRALVSEYRLTTSKMQRYNTRENRVAATGGGHGVPPLRRREAAEGEGTTAHLLKLLETLVEKMRPALVASSDKKGYAARNAAWQYVSAELDAALMTATTEESSRISAPMASGRGRRSSAAEMPHATGKSKKRAATGKRKRARSSSSEELADSTEASDTESASSSAASRSFSASGSSASATPSATSLSQTSVDIIDDDDRDARVEC